MTDKQGKAPDGPKSFLGKVVSVQMNDREETFWENVELRSIGSDGVCLSYESRSVYHNLWIPTERINYLVQKFSAPVAPVAPTQATV